MRRQVNRLSPEQHNHVLEMKEQQAEEQLEPARNATTPLGIDYLQAHIKIPVSLGQGARLNIYFNCFSNI
jgi:hypothetical protein